MLKIGNYNTLEIVKTTPQGLYLDSSEGEILLPKRYITSEMEVGDEIQVFIYTDSEDRLVAITDKPLAVVGEFAFLEVKALTSFGAFLDWGLPKDLFVPHKEQHLPMRVGQKYVVRVALDFRTQRVIGVNRIGSFLEKDNIELSENQKVNLLPYETTSLGIMCIIDGLYAGMLYKNEVFQKIELGKSITGYVQKVREDNKIDLSLRLGGFDYIKGDAVKILEKLEENNGILRFSDKSDPKDIKDYFGMSKKTFKKLIGNLYRKGKIIIESHQIRLK